MRLAEFIEKTIDDIVDEWAEFAQSSLPPARDLCAADLRDHAKAMLEFIAQDMAEPQSGDQQHDKSRGKLPDNAPGLTRTAKDDAEQRFRQGFTLNEVLAEYRALRASVIRRWREQLSDADLRSLDDLVRFSEAIDQAAREAVFWYVGRVEESRNLMLGVLGHDLRNPLGAARASADYLLRADGLSGVQTKVVARIQASTSRMQQMVNDLLDFTRTRLGGGLPIVVGQAHMGQICRETVNELEAYHPGRHIEMACSGGLDGEWDSGRMAQLVSNLAANALQHGTPDAPVSLNVDDTGDGIDIRVHNQGPPIDPEARPSLFDPSMRPVIREAELRDGSSGLGLGLFIVREIAVAHGGDVRVESTANDGTTFTVHLPKKPPLPGSSRRKSSHAGRL